MATLKSLVDVPLPDGWKPIDVTEHAGKTDGFIEAVYLAPRAVEKFAANIVVLSTDAMPPSTDDLFQASIQSLIEEIPGYFVVDQQPWSSDHFSGALICGTYIMEETSVTSFRWLLVGNNTTVSLDATCATSELSSMAGVFFDVANSCQER